MVIDYSKIGNQCSVGDGAHASIQRLDSGVPYLSSKNFKLEGIDLSDVSYISQSDFEKHFKETSKALTRLKKNDLVLSIIGSIGAPYLVKENDFFGISSSVAIIRPQSSINAQYLYYYLKTSGVQNYVDAIKSGSAQGFLSLEMIKSIPLQFPDLPTQQRIAGVLSAYDELIDVNNQRIRLLEDTARQLYKEWFVRLRFPGYEQTHFVKGLPEGWEVKKLGDVIELAYGKALKDEDRKGGEFPVYGSSGIVGYHDNYIAKAPGIIVGRKGNVGSVFGATENFFPIDTAFFVNTKTSLYYVYFNLLLSQNFIEGDSAVPGLNRSQAYAVRHKDIDSSATLSLVFCALKDG